MNYNFYHSATDNRYLSLFYQSLQTGKHQPRGTGNEGFISFAKRLITKLYDSDRSTTAERYATAVRSFLRFMGHDVRLSMITPSLIERYETSLRSNGVTSNSTSFYMRNLRAIYNRAVDQGLVEQQNPFKQVYTGVGKTVKRALNLTTMRHIKSLELPQDRGLRLARDMFLMSFYLRGMSFIDMAFLRKSDLRGGHLSYYRHKTGQQLQIKWEAPMQELLENWPRNTTKFLLPIITNPQQSERQQFANAQRLINKKLKLIAQKLHIDTPLSMYCARHSWCSIARDQNIPISVISECMGHDSEKTTRIYLSQLDSTTIDRANKRIISLL